jgi:hypothetical protein
MKSGRCERTEQVFIGQRRLPLVVPSAYIQSISLPHSASLLPGNVQLREVVGKG